jgi:hypothetical protein
MQQYLKYFGNISVCSTAAVIYRIPRQKCNVSVFCMEHGVGALVYSCETVHQFFSA